MEADAPRESEQSDESPTASAAAAAPVVAAWPRKQAVDVVRAWVVLEIAGFQPGQEALLLNRMSVADKRLWLSRRLYRHHHGPRLMEEEAILFVEATRAEPAEVLAQLRTQYDGGVGLAGDLSATLEVTFKDENSAGSAVRREWFGIVSEAFLAPAARVLTSTDKGATVRPMPMLGDDADAERQLRDLEMLGRFLGLALLQHVTVGVRLHPSVCRLLLNGNQRWQWTPDDIRALDAELYAHKVKYVLENDVTHLCLDFTDVLPDASPPSTSQKEADKESANGGGGGGSGGVPPPPIRVELLEGGEAIDVTESNKQQFVDLVCEWRLFGSIERQARAMHKGLEAAVPAEILEQLAMLVTPDDLSRMLAGEPEIDVRDWQVNSAVSGGLMRTGKLFKWFWRAVRSFSAEDRERLLRFVTGSKRPPVGGFAQLQGFNGGVHRFTICASNEPKDSLPRAHACICTIDMPEYTSYRTLRRALHTALSLGSIGFDDGAVNAAAADDTSPPTAGEDAGSTDQAAGP